MKITVGIKALNEEAHIGAALASAVSAVTPLGGEVVLADSGSTDDTVAIAQRFPVRIVQLANRSDACCGAGAQLAFQAARGDYFCLIDGDMKLRPGFLETAIDFLERHSEVAGVGGHVVDHNVASAEFEIREAMKAQEAHRQPGLVDRLDGGGVYRADAIRAVGYFGDRNLHAFEEFDLAVRLRSAGWKLARIDQPAVDHYGHVANGYALLWRRLRSGYAAGAGEVLRAAWARPHLGLVLRGLGHVRHSAVVIAWWLALGVAAFVLPWGLPVLIAVPVAFLAWRRGSLRLGLYSFASWNVSAVGMVRGLFRRRVEPATPLPAIDLSASATSPQGLREAR